MYPKKLESLMNFWQKGIRFAYNELQEFYNWSDD